MLNFKEVNGGQGKGCRGSHPGDKQDDISGTSKVLFFFETFQFTITAKHISCIPLLSTQLHLHSECTFQTFSLIHIDSRLYR